MLLPPLSYGISRDIEVPWLAPTAYSLAFLSFAVLLVLNGS